MVELCKDRVGLMLNPEGPKGAQLWNSRRVSITGLPSEPGWPQEAQILSGGVFSGICRSCACLSDGGRSSQIIAAESRRGQGGEGGEGVVGWLSSQLCSVEN